MKEVDHIHVLSLNRTRVSGSIVVFLVVTNFFIFPFLYKNFSDGKKVCAAVNNNDDRGLVVYYKNEHLTCYVYVCCVPFY